MLPGKLMHHRHDVAQRLTRDHREEMMLNVVIDAATEGGPRAVPCKHIIGRAELFRHPALHRRRLSRRGACGLVILFLHSRRHHLASCRCVVGRELVRGHEGAYDVGRRGTEG